MASDVKDGGGKNATDGILNFSETGRRIKVAHGDFVTALHYEFSFFIPIKISLVNNLLFKDSLIPLK